jgi:hypothetical protein
MKFLKAILGPPLVAIGMLFSLFVVWIAFTAVAAVFDTSYSFGQRTRDQVKNGTCPDMPKTVINNPGNNINLSLGDGKGDVWLSNSPGYQSTSYWDIEEVSGQVCPKVRFLAEEFYTTRPSSDLDFNWRYRIDQCGWGLKPCTPAMMSVIKRTEYTMKDGKKITYTMAEPICETDQYEAGCPGRTPPA